MIPMMKGAFLNNLTEEQWKENDWVNVRLRRRLLACMAWRCNTTYDVEATSK